MPTNNRRGSRYRSTYCVLLDDPDYRRLDPKARLVLWTVMYASENNMAGIYPYSEGVIADRSGLKAAEVSRALGKLQKAGFLLFQDHIVWIRNQLRFDPSRHRSGVKGEKAVENIIAGLPRSEIVAKFCSYYEIRYPFDTQTDWATDCQTIPDPFSDSESDSESESNTSLVTTDAVTEGDGKYSDGFLRAWKEHPHYPGRSKKLKAFRIWKRQGLEGKTDAVLAELAIAKRSETWRKENGQFVPAFDRWIKDREFGDAPARADPDAPIGWEAARRIVMGED